MSTRIKLTDRPPCCKPFRITELIVISTCFILLFFLRQFNPQDEIICSPSILIVLFTNIGSTLLISLVDVTTQAFREPIPNSPMVLTLLLGFANCLSTGISSLVVYSKYEKDRSHRNLNTLCLLAGGCFLASLLYVLDVLIVIRLALHVIKRTLPAMEKLIQKLEEKGKIAATNATSPEVLCTANN